MTKNRAKGLTTQQRYHANTNVKLPPCKKVVQMTQEHYNMMKSPGGVSKCKNKNHTYNMLSISFQNTLTFHKSLTTLTLLGNILQEVPHFRQCTIKIDEYLRKKSLTPLSSQLDTCPDGYS
jgi:hypothetical protein